MNFQIPGSCN